MMLPELVEGQIIAVLRVSAVEYFKNSCQDNIVLCNGNTGDTDFRGMLRRLKIMPYIAFFAAWV